MKVKIYRNYFISDIVFIKQYKILRFKRYAPNKTSKNYVPMISVDPLKRAVFFSWLPVNRGRDINISCEV